MKRYNVPQGCYISTQSPNVYFPVQSVGSNPPHRIPFQELNSNVAPGKNIDSIETIDDRSGLNWVSLTLKHVLLSQLILSRLKRKTDADECHITSTPRPVSQNTKHETSVEPESSLHTVCLQHKSVFKYHE